MKPRPTAAGIRLALLLAAAAAGAAPAGAAEELDALRQNCVAAAADLRQHIAALAALDRDVDLRGRELAGRQRGLDESRSEQTNLLATLQLIARDAPDQRPFVAAPPLARLRGELLMQGLTPALRAEGHALSGEITRVAGLRQEVAAKEGERVAAADAVAKDRDRLARLIAERLELTRQLLPEDAGAEARASRLAREASNFEDLIKRADTETDRRDKEILAQARAALAKTPKARPAALTIEAADPTRPQPLRALDLAATSLAMPVAGTISRHFGAADASGASQGLSLAAAPAAPVVAPFDGRVVYTGLFRQLGLGLIIRHAGGYHSLLAGLGRIDSRVDQWVISGEPVGAMPDAGSGELYVELRRDGRPIDFEPWLATDDAAAGERHDGNQKVRE